MPEEITPTSPEETPENPTPTPNPEPVEAEPTPAPEQPEVPEPKPEETVDYWKNRYAESTREAQVIAGREKEKDARIEQLIKQHPPTETELREAFPEWDQMMAHEQRMARQQLASQKRTVAAENRVAQLEAERAWEKDLKKAKRAFPALQGKEDDFEEYVMKPGHRSAPIDVLAKAFLSDTPAPTPTPTPRPGVQRGNGGPKALDTTKKMTAEEAKTLRTTNYTEYKRQLDAGNIDIEV